MILHPTVVIGVGSTGKFVVHNAEKYLYEVLNGERLRLFKFLVFETAINQQEQGTGVHTKPVSIKVEDIGGTYLTFKDNLKEDFTWCPVGMQIAGAGAGNKRAGGRLMFFQHVDAICGVIQNALDEVRQAATDNHTTREINALLRERGGREQQHPMPNLPVPVVIVVGTLAGGTCSGTCVDIGYALRRIAPSSHREALFFLPDQGAINTYKANSWAALSDLVYFTEHPESYNAVWLTKAQQRESYSEGTQPGPEPPYKKIYVVTQRDQSGNAHLPYRDDVGSPLLMMGGLFLVANVLGLHELRYTRLVDLNTRVGSDPVYNTFLTHSLRGVSYPKYEISEAATCRIISGQICDHWLSKEACFVQGRHEDLQQEETNKQGRELWNSKCPPIWNGLHGNVNLRELAQRINSHKDPDVAKYIKAQITENQADRIFRSVDQNVENRRRDLQHAIRSGLVEVLQQKQNLQYAEWFLDGIQAEIERSRKYWQSLGTPAGGDIPAWQAKADELCVRLERRYTALSPNMLNQRLEVIEDELGIIIGRLEMFLMYGTVGEVAHWIDTEIRPIVADIRTLLSDLQAFANGRSNEIAHGLEDRSGPLLKISRSPDRGFSKEIELLSKSVPTILGREFIDFAEGHFTGLLRDSSPAAGSPMERLFQRLVDRIQPALIRELQQGGAIDIVTEIESQQVKPQAIQRAHATQALSLATRHHMMVGQDNVPSFLLTKSTESSTRLDASLRQVDPAFPALKAEELPLFDHMALFYQEGGKFNLDSLLHESELKRAYDETKKVDAEILDPLRQLRSIPATTKSPSVDSVPKAGAGHGTEPKEAA